MQTANLRAALGDARRVVVKIGSRVLVQKSGRPDRRRMTELVRQVAALVRQGREVVVVSSGAIGSGMEALHMRRRPTTLPDLQMAAAVGQSRLMAAYDQLFARHGLRMGQVLLTHDDLRHRSRHLNARNTMMNLLRHGIVPIVNENDVVAVDEIKFGDNDLLAALVSILVEAQALILLTTVDGFRAPGAGGRTRRVPLLQGVSEENLQHAVGKGSELSTGGMASKLQSAGMVAHNGIPVVIANGRSDGVVERIVAGNDVGTLIAPSGTDLSHRQRWITFFHRTEGAVVVDDGAREALEAKGRSLLPIGIRAVEGEFEAGAVVLIKAMDGAILARGLTDYSSTEINLVKGKRSAEVAALAGSPDYAEVIHRDNMVFEKKEAAGATRMP
jgi:glutamate 5-kinase